MGVATDDDYATEFLDLKLSVRGGRLARRRHRPHHPLRLRPQRGHRHHATCGAADRFTREVDAAAVLVNASTRFVDGEEFGFGAEIGITTQKLHARGPDGPARAHHPQVRRPRRRPDPPQSSRG